MKTELRQPYRTFFGTLASQCRIDIIQALKDRPLNVTEISRKAKLKQSTVSHNLQRLLACGFVFFERKGKEKVYGLNKDTIKPLLLLMKTHMKNYCEHHLMD